MLDSNKVIEQSWLPDWAYGIGEKESIQNSCLYWDDDIYAREETVTETFYFRAAPSLEAMEIM